MLHDSTVTVAVVRTRPRAIPLPMITMRKSIHGFLFPYMVMGLRARALLSNTRYSVSSGYPRTGKRVENTTHSGVFLTKFKVFG